MRFNHTTQEAEKERVEAMVRLDEIKQSSGQHTEAIQSKNDELNRVQVTVPNRELGWNKQKNVRDRLLRRVSELEHQLSERASELARRSEIRRAVLRYEMNLKLSNQEATTRAELESNAERLSSIREQIELEERRLRSLEEQVVTLRDRQADAQSKSSASEEKSELLKHDWIKSKQRHFRVDAEQRKNVSVLLKMKHDACNFTRNARIDGRAKGVTD